MFSNANTNLMHPSIVNIPYIPPLVDLQDIYPNNMLLPPEEIARLRTLNLKEGMNCKKETGCKYDIIFKDEELYAMYLGRKHVKQLGQGAFGVVKYAQNLQTGTWVVRKLSINNNPDIEKNEADKLKLVNMLIETKNHFCMSFFDNSQRISHKRNELIIKNIPGIELYDLIGLRSQYFSIYMKLQLSINLAKKLLNLHMQNISHYDLHDGNILFNPTKNEMEIIDYGNSSSENDGGFHSDRSDLIGHIESLISYINYSDLNIIDFTIDNDPAYSLKKREASIIILQRIIQYLENEKNKIPLDQRIFNVALLDIGSGKTYDIINLKKFPIVILVDSSNGNYTDTLFRNVKHDLEKAQVFVYDKAISHWDQSTLQLQQLAKEYDAECTAQFIDAITGQKLDNKLEHRDTNFRCIN